MIHPTKLRLLCGEPVVGFTTVPAPEQSWTKGLAGNQSLIPLQWLILLSRILEIIHTPRWLLGLPERNRGETRAVRPEACIIRPSSAWPRESKWSSLTSGFLSVDLRSLNVSKFPGSQTIGRIWWKLPTSFLEKCLNAHTGKVVHLLSEGEGKT